MNTSGASRAPCNEQETMIVLASIKITCMFEKLFFYHQHVFIIYISYNGTLVNKKCYRIRCSFKFFSCEVSSPYEISFLHKYQLAKH